MTYLILISTTQTMQKDALLQYIADVGYTSLILIIFRPFLDRYRVEPVYLE